MDYKYIEQLLERYWECQTTLEEEAILRNFFAQSDIPARLLPYASLFQAEEGMANEHLSDDFDQRVMEAIEEKKVGSTAHVVALNSRNWAEVLRPLWRAAAVVAIVLTIGMAAQQGFKPRGGQTGNEQMMAAQTTDTIELFTDQPELSPQTEAALPASQTDTLKIISQ
ncbi:MAG: pyruvate ferredoxin oxidoreductase [Bacteroidaceae bacterium]|nr:pyruvate ferredoxin oxidoreductase [Bacteroidaceae bacterium]